MGDEQDLFLLVSSGCRIKKNALTLLVLLNVLDMELSRSKLVECSCRPLALLPYIKKRQSSDDPGGFHKGIS